jgi:hypothetical protein
MPAETADTDAKSEPGISLNSFSVFFMAPLKAHTVNRIFCVSCLEVIPLKRSEFRLFRHEFRYQPQKTGSKGNAHMGKMGEKI